MQEPDSSPTSPPRNPVIPSEKERWQLHFPACPRPRLLQRVPELPASQAAVKKRDFQGCGRNKAKTRSWEVVLAVKVTGRGSFRRAAWEDGRLNLNRLALCFVPPYRTTIPVFPFISCS